MGLTDSRPVQQPEVMPICLDHHHQFPTRLQKFIKRAHVSIINFTWWWKSRFVFFSIPKTEPLSAIALTNSPWYDTIFYHTIWHIEKTVPMTIIANSIPFACGANKRRVTLAPPALCPAIVTWLGSPPKALMFLLTHRKASIWSKIPAFPGTSSVSNERNPKML